MTVQNLSKFLFFRVLEYIWNKTCLCCIIQCVTMKKLMNGWTDLNSFLVACYVTLHPTLSVRPSVRPSVGHTLLFWGFSCPNNLVTSTTALAHPYATGVAVYPALLHVLRNIVKSDVRIRVYNIPYCSHNGSTDSAGSSWQNKVDKLHINCEIPHRTRIVYEFKGKLDQERPHQSPRESSSSSQDIKAIWKGRTRRLSQWTIPIPWTRPKHDQS